MRNVDELIEQCAQRAVTTITFSDEHSAVIRAIAREFAWAGEVVEAARELRDSIVDPSDVARVFSKWVDENKEFREPQLTRLREAILAVDATLAVAIPGEKERRVK